MDAGRIAMPRPNFLNQLAAVGRNPFPEPAHFLRRGSFLIEQKEVLPRRGAEFYLI
jgi:hypothetical protein